MAEFETADIAPQVAQTETQPDPPSKRLYNALVSTNKYNLPNYEQFSVDMKDTNKRKKLLETVKNEGLYGRDRSLNDFNSHFFTDIDVKKKETTSPVSSPVAQQLTKPSVPIQNSFGIAPDNSAQEVQSIIGGQQVTPSSSIAPNQSQYGWAESPVQAPITPQYATTAPSDQASDQYRKDVKEKDLAKQSTSAEFTNTLLNPNSPLIQNKSLFAQSLVRETKPEEQAMIQQNFSNLKPEYQQDIANYLAKVQVDNPNKHAELVSRIGENGLDQKTKAAILSQATNDRLQKAARDFSILEARNKQGKQINPNDAEKAIGEYNQSINDMSQVLQQFPEEIDRLRKVKAQNDEMTIKDSDSFLVKAAKQTGALLGGVQNSILDGTKSTLEWARDISDQLSGEQDTRGLTDKAVEGIGNFLDSWHAATPTKYKNEKDLQGENAGGAQEFIAQLGAQFGNMGMLYALGAGSKARLVTAGAATSYGQYYDEADKTGSLSKDGVQKYALFQSTIQGLLELVNPNFGVAEFERVGLKSGIEFLKNNPNANIGNYAKDVFKKNIGENAQETIQNTGGVLGKVAANALIGKDVFDPSMTAEEQMQTVTMTTATTLLASFITKGRFRDYHKQSLDFLRNVPEAKLIDELNQQVQDGNLTYTQADKIKTLVSDKENTPVVEGEKQGVAPSIEKENADIEEKKWQEKKAIYDNPKFKDAYDEAASNPLYADGNGGLNETFMRELINGKHPVLDEMYSLIEDVNKKYENPTPSVQTPKAAEKVQEVNLESVTKDELLNESKPTETAKPSEPIKEEVKPTTEPSAAVEPTPTETITATQEEAKTEPETTEQRTERVNKTVKESGLKPNSQKAVLGVINDTKDAKLLDVLPKEEKAKAQKIISDIYAEDKQNAPKQLIDNTQGTDSPTLAKEKPKNQLQKGQKVGANSKEVKDFEPTNIQEELEQYLAQGGKINEQDFKDYFGDGKGGVQPEMAKWRDNIDTNAPSLDQITEGSTFKERGENAKDAFQSILQENADNKDVAKRIKEKSKVRKETIEGKNNPYESADYEQAMKDLETEKNKVKEEDVKAYNEFAYNTHDLDAQAASDKAVAEKHAESLNRIINDPQYKNADGSFNYDKLNDNIEKGFEPDILEYFTQAEKLGIKTSEANEQIKSAANNGRTTEGSNENPNTEKGNDGRRDEGNAESRADGKQGGENKTPLVLYHGTPHKFENFDISKLGSGEGAQVFGHGLYFTTVKKIAEWYANGLSTKQNFWKYLVDGNNILMSKSDFDFIQKELDSLGYDGSVAENHSLETIVVDGKDIFAPEVLDALAVLFGKNAEKSLKDYDLSQTEIDRMMDIKRKISNPQLYTVNVKNGDFINWHEKLSDAQKSKLAGIDTQGTGEEVYKKLSNKLGSDKKASEYLDSKGIDGVIYKTEKGTGGADGKGRNYVVFNEKNIKIEQINGESKPNLAEQQSDSSAKQEALKPNTPTEIDENNIIDALDDKQAFIEQKVAELDTAIEQAEKDLKKSMKGIVASSGLPFNKGGVFESAVRLGYLKFKKFFYTNGRAMSMSEMAEALGTKITDGFSNVYNRVKEIFRKENSSTFHEELSFADQAARMVQDKNVAVKNLYADLENAGVPITDETNFAEMQELSTSKIADAQRRVAEWFRGMEGNAQVFGIAKSQKESWVGRVKAEIGSYKEQLDYMYAKHALGFNARAREILDKRKEAAVAELQTKADALTTEYGNETDPAKQKALKDRITKLNNQITEIQNEPYPDKPSGMSDTDANAILDEAAKDPAKMAKKEAFAKEFRDRIVTERINLLEQSGIISAETAKNMREGKREGFTSELPDYLPLKVKEENFTEIAKPTTLQQLGSKIFGIKVTDKYTREQRYDPIQMAVTELQAAHSAAIQNEGLNALYDAVKQSPFGKNIKIINTRGTYAANEEGQLIDTKTDPSVEVRDLLNDHAIPFKVGGKIKYLFFTPIKNADGKLVKHPVMQALKVQPKDTPAILKAITNGIRALTNYLRLIRTTYNLGFAADNPFRDLGEALANISDVSKDSAKVEKIRLGIIANMPKSFGYFFNPKNKRIGLDGKTRDKDFDKYFDEMRREGVMMSWGNYEGIQEKIDNFQADVDRIEQGKYGKTQQELAMTSFKILGALSEATENTTRLAVFVSMRENGYSPQKAAYVAKNITLNFEKGGTETPFINTLFMFSNAGIQGAFRSVKAAKSKNFWRFGAAMTLFAALNRAALFMGMDDDDEDKWIYNDIESQGRTLIYNPFDPKNPIRLPKPYSAMRIFLNLGEGITDVYHGKRTVSDVAVNNIGGALMQAIDPLGGSGKSLTNYVPTEPLKNYWQVRFNENWAGQPILRSQDKDEKSGKAEYMRTNPNTEAIFDKTALFLHDKGILDIQSTTLEFIYDNYAKNAVNAVEDYIKLATAIIDKITGKEVKAEDVPALKRFYSNIEDKAKGKAVLYEVLDIVQDPKNMTKEQIRFAEKQLERFKKEGVSEFFYNKISEGIAKAKNPNIEKSKEDAELVKFKQGIDKKERK